MRQIQEPLIQNTSAPTKECALPPTEAPPQQENLFDPQSSLSELAEASLKKGNLSRIDLFERAEALEPEKTSLLLRHAGALYAFGTDNEDIEALKLANKKLKKALKLKVEKETLEQRAKTFLALAEHTDEFHYYIEAEKSYNALNNGFKDLSAEIHWDGGKILYSRACHSEEIEDFQRAITAFEKALQKQEILPSQFWEDYGNIYFSLFERLERIDLLHKAIHLYKKGVVSELSSGARWLCLSTALSTLYKYTQDEYYFSSGNESFDTASQLDPENPDVWIEWARFLLAVGRGKKEEKLFIQAIDKCQKAIESGCEQTVSTAIWSEAMAELGLMRDDGQMLAEARRKIVALYEEEGCDVDLALSAGLCLFRVADYFKDLEDYYTAISYFQEGLSLDRTNAALWHQMGEIFTVVAKINEDNNIYELADKFYKKATSLSKNSCYICDQAVMLSEYGIFNEDTAWLKFALEQFDYGFDLQKRPLYLPSKWLYHYGTTLLHLALYIDDEAYYNKAATTFAHLLTIDPEYPNLHTKYAEALAQYGESTSDVDLLKKALHHFRLAEKYAPEDDAIFLSWGIALINLALIVPSEETDALCESAERKFLRAAHLGNTESYYQLACLYCFLRQPEKAMRFILKAHTYDALPSLEEMVADDWIDSLLPLERFQALMAEIEKKSAQEG